MHRLAVLVLLVAAPALAKKKPPPPPPLPPLVLDAAAPVITVSIDGKPLVLRVDPAAGQHVQINASAAKRLDLGNPARLVAGEAADMGSTTTQIGKVAARETTTTAIARYADRDVPLALAWSSRDHVGGADGMIGPRFLPHDEIRFVRRPVTADDRTTHVGMEWSNDRGLLGATMAGDHVVDIQINPFAPETIATSAAAVWLIETQGGRLDGPVRDVAIGQGITRPVRDVVFDRPVTIAGIRLTRVATRLFDWSGKTSLPADATANDEEIIVRAKFDGQRQWPKLAIGSDHLDRCAHFAWHRLPLSMDLTCPAP